MSMQILIRAATGGSLVMATKVLCLSIFQHCCKTGEKNKKGRNSSKDAWQSKFLESLGPESHFSGITAIVLLEIKQTGADQAGIPTHRDL